MHLCVRTTYIGCMHIVFVHRVYCFKHSAFKPVLYTLNPNPCDMPEDVTQTIEAAIDSGAPQPCPTVDSGYLNKGITGWLSGCAAKGFG